MRINAKCFFFTVAVIDLMLYVVFLNTLNMKNSFSSFIPQSMLHELWLNNSNQDSNELFYPTPVNTMPPIFTREREAEEESSPSPEQKEIKEIAEDPVSDLTNPVDKDTKPSLRTRSDEIQDRPVEEKESKEESTEPKNPPKIIPIEERHIDFFSPDWYESFQSQMNDIYEHYNPSENSKWANLYKDDGYSKAIVEKYFAYVTNVCYDFGKKSVVMYSDDSKELERTIGSSTIKKNNVVNTFKIVHGRMPEAFHVLDDMGIYVSHPRQGRQTYHFMEAYTYLINVAIQPQLHPPITKIYIVDFSPEREYPWSTSASKLVQNIFPENFRPQLLYQREAKKMSDSNRLCAKAMTFIHNWDIGHGGFLIGNFFAVDVLKAVAYKQAHVTPPSSMPERLVLTLLLRRNKRKILNEEDLIGNLTQKYESSLMISPTIFDHKSPEEQYSTMAATDIFLTPHGAGMINIFFLLPHSYVIELNPPLWKFGCYREESKCSNVEHAFVQAKGNKVGKECEMYGMKDIRCHFAGIRDQNFYVDIPDALDAVRIGIRSVKHKKYPQK